MLQYFCTNILQYNIEFMYIKHIIGKQEDFFALFDILSYFYFCSWPFLKANLFSLQFFLVLYYLLYLCIYLFIYTCLFLFLLLL